MLYTVLTVSRGLWRPEAGVEGLEEVDSIVLLFSTVPLGLVCVCVGGWGGWLLFFGTPLNLFVVDFSLISCIELVLKS